MHSALPIVLYGEWNKSTNYFDVIDFTYAADTEQELYDLLAYEIEGSNPKLARKIINALGNEAKNALTQPNIIKQFCFLGNLEKAQTICNSFKQKTVGNMAKISLVSKYGFSQDIAHKITSLASEEEIARIVGSNIYLFCEKPFSISLRAIERIAQKIHQGLNSFERLKWHAVSVLEDAGLDGHLYLEEKVFVEKLTSALNSGFQMPMYSSTTIDTMLKTLFNEGTTLKLFVGRVYLTHVDKNEKLFAANLVQRLQTPIIVDNALLQDAINSYEAFEGIRFAEGQRKAIETSVTSPVSIVTGGPGTGKTTVIKGIIAVMRKIFGYNEQDFRLMAPTGKAAHRMSESTGHKATTIHSGIQLGVEENEGTQQMLTEKVIIIDESSILDQKVAYALLQAIPLTSKVIFVGDVDQLESIGAGDVLSSMIKSGAIPVAELSVIYRQENTSDIVTNAAKIKMGDTDLIFSPSFALETVKDESEATDSIVRAYVEAVNKYGAENVALLCPRRRNAEVCVQNLNPLLQKAVNQNTNAVLVGNTTFIVGDRVIQTKNTSNVANGEMGVIVAIYKQLIGKTSAYRLKIDFSGNILEYDEEEMQNIDLAYATTIHKSQGSEYKHVIIPLLLSQSNMLKRKLFYTAVTRAKHSVLLVGQKAALIKAITRCDNQQRNTLLADRLVSYLKKLQQNK